MKINTSSLKRSIIVTNLINLTKLTREKRKVQAMEIISERGYVTTEPEDIMGTITEYFKIILCIQM
jgi:hypothetical protein